MIHSKKLGHFVHVCGVCHAKKAVPEMTHVLTGGTCYVYDLSLQQQKKDVGIAAS